MDENLDLMNLRSAYRNQIITFQQFLECYMEIIKRI